jgi:hypothetical protein
VRATAPPAPPLFAPTYAATAHVHGALPPDLQARSLDGLLAEVEAWTLTTCGPALLFGDALPADREAAVAEQLARYTGLAVDDVRLRRGDQRRRPA